MVQLSVVIPFHNAAATLPRCLEALRAQDFARDGFEVIAVDNNSTDRSLELVRRYPEVRLLQEGTQGAYVARNRGVAAARGRILAFTDPDCVPVPGWLAAIAREMKRSDTGVVLGGYIVPRHPPALRLLVCYENTKDAFVFATEAPELYYGHTNNMAVRREVFERFGPFVERRRGADTILVRRVVDGLSCRAVRYCPEALVEHLELADVLTYYRKLTLYGESRESYRQVSWTRPLTLSERLTVFRRTGIAHALSATGAAHLLLLLSVGLLAWRAGRARAQWHRLTSGPSAAALNFHERPPSPS
ncbi:MAG TPA: glycosyltransferase family A protein [Gemmatimonadales bacterium]